MRIEAKGCMMENVRSSVSASGWDTPRTVPHFISNCIDEDLIMEKVSSFMSETSPTNKQKLKQSL